jgi:hypothetical protein
LIANSPPIIPRTDPTPVRKLPAAKSPTTEKTTMIVPQAENCWVRKLITTALTKTRIPETISKIAEIRALARAKPKFVDRTPFPTKLLKAAAEAVYLTIPLVEAFATPPMNVNIPASKEIA